MALLLKNAHVIDPQVGLNETADILIRDGKIVEIGQGLSLEKGAPQPMAASRLFAPCPTPTRSSTTPLPSSM